MIQFSSMSAGYLRIFIGILLFCLSGCDSHSSQMEWRHLKADGTAGWTITDESKSDGGAIVKGRVGDVLVQIREWKSNAAEAQTQFKGLDLALNNLYDSFIAPYPGVVSSTVICPDKFRPVRWHLETGEDWIKSFRQLATDRFQYGVCDDKNGYYMSYDILYFCAKQNLTYEARLFARQGTPAVTQMDQLHEKFHCN